MPHRLHKADITTYEPTKEDLDFAKKFVDWNTLSHGIQRIDTIRKKDSSLLLMEVEDHNQYLYLLEVDNNTRERIVPLVIKSIKAIF